MRLSTQPIKRRYFKSGYSSFIRWIFGNTKTFNNIQFTIAIPFRSFLPIRRSAVVFGARRPIISRLSANRQTQKQSCGRIILDAAIS